MQPRSRAHTLDVLAAWEPSFQQVGPDGGRFTLPHVPVAVSVHRDSYGWHTLTLPLPPPAGAVGEGDATGLAAQLLEAHQRFIAPVKFARDHRSGDYLLIGEMALGRTAHDLASQAMFASIREGMAQGVATFKNLLTGNKVEHQRQGSAPPAEDHVPQEFSSAHIQE